MASSLSLSFSMPASRAMNGKKNGRQRMKPPACTREAVRHPLEQQTDPRMGAIERRDDQAAARCEQDDGLDDLYRSDQRHADLPADHREGIDGYGHE